MLLFNHQTLNKRFLLMMVLFLLLGVGCDYVANNNNIYPNLSDADYAILNNSDPLATYQFDYEGELSFGLGIESYLALLRGSGVIRQTDSSLLPDMQFTMTITNPTNGQEGTVELLTVDGRFYQRSVSLTNPDLNTDWVVTEFGDFAGTFGLALPIPGEAIDSEVIEAVGGAEDYGVEAYSTITRVDDIEIDGVMSAHFIIQNDLKSFLLSDTMLPLLAESILTEAGLDPAAYSPDQIRAMLTDSLEANFKTLNIQVDQYVNLSTGLQNRATTNLIWETDPSALDGATAGSKETFMVNLYIDTRYRDYYEPVVIAAPEISSTPAPLPPVVDGSDTPDDTNIPPVVGIPNLPSGERVANTVQAQIVPTQVDKDVCSTEVITEVFEVTLPPREATQLDVVVVLDVSSSMSAEIDEVKRAISNIAAQLSALVPDTRIAVVTFSDHPGFLDQSNDADSPYTLVSDFTSNIEQLNSTINAITLQSGGETIEESTLFALDQTATLGWRPDALRIISLFTDAPSHEIDPGPDGELDTSDDITQADVIATLQGRGIRVISIQSSSQLGRDSAATRFMSALSNGTNGIRETLNSADEIPNVMVETIGLLVGGQLKFVASGQSFNFTTDVLRGSWIDFSPDSFDYPSEGGTIPVSMTLYPHRAGLRDGNYQMELELQDNLSSYGQALVNFDYNNLCANVVVADTPTDDGIRCSVEGPQDLTVFWESPDIIVRRSELFVERSEAPVFGSTNYVWVQVTNLGPRDTDLAQLNLYASPNPFEAEFPGTWEQIGERSFPLTANTSEWIGPFPFVPANNRFAIRAVIGTDEDISDRPNDFACDGNIAQQNLIFMTLDIPSYGNRLIGGEIPVQIQAPQDLTYNTLDLRLRSVDATSGIVRFYLDNQAFTAWNQQGSNAQGGTLIAPQVFLLTSDELLLDDVVGGPNIAIDARLEIASDSSTGGKLPISLHAVDRTVLGATIIYDVDTSTLPSRYVDNTTEEPPRPSWQQYDKTIPIALSIGLLFLLVGVGYFRRNKQR